METKNNINGGTLALIAVGSVLLIACGIQLVEGASDDGINAAICFVGFSLIIGFAYYITQYNRQKGDDNKEKMTHHGNGTPAQMWFVVKVILCIIFFISFISQCDEREREHQKSVRKVQDSYNRYYR